ncbi:MAG: protein translocase subunit SecD [Bacteriovoracaceae bacterium]|nr:protein translocase subunit SecD [Bacteriovoracaceae bacterium]
MNRSWWIRFWVLIVATVLAVLIVTPTIFNVREDAPLPFTKKITLGLDLQGGLYMVLGIDFTKVYRDEIRNNLTRAKMAAEDEGIKLQVGSIDAKEPSDPLVSVTVEGDVAKAKEKIRSYLRSTVRLVQEQGQQLTYGLVTTVKDNIKDQSVKKSIEVIRNRIDEFGVNEPEINSQGNDRIVVVLPGVKDIERAKSLIGKTAKLEFKMVNDSISAGQIQEWLALADKAGIKYEKGGSFSGYIQQLNDYLQGKLPAGWQFAFERKLGAQGQEIEERIPYIVEEVPRLTGDDLQDAQSGANPQDNMPIVNMELKATGAKIFEKVTGDNIGKRMAIILDGNVYSAPVIQSRIGGGRAQITMGGHGYQKLAKEATDLALVLRAGALPVQLDFLEQRTVGPTLGQESIHRASVASACAAAVVFLLMIFYYRVAGFISVVTLSLNVLFVFAGLVAIGATLTLPGIAGVALTVGMAVDGNIIIYERIREEMRKGVPYYRCAESGFDTAFWTILDANVTSAMAGLCLLNFGTGPIRGFAVTFLIGIVITVYTSYFVNRMLLDLYMNKVQGQELSI